MVVGEASSFDYIIVGAGPSGVVVAARLREKIPSASILLVEAGNDETDFELAKHVKHIGPVRGSRIDWSFDTVPQKHLHGRPIKKGFAGKALSGGAALNVGAWTRGPAVCYDRWADLTGDKSWSFQELLPYFRRCESFDAPHADGRYHGRDGPMRLSSPAANRGLHYPLFDDLKSAWQSMDRSLKWLPDINTGSLLGMGEPPTTFFQNNERQFPHLAYNLKGVEILTNSTVHKVLLRSQTRAGEYIATGIRLVSGREILATQEVIVSAGAYNSPKILLLSGIGPSAELQKHGISVQVDSPYVGKGLRDDMNVRQFWKLRNPERGLAFGSPAMADPRLTTALPLDFMVWMQAPREQLLAALAKDGITDENHEVLHPHAVHQESFMSYNAGRSPALTKELGLENDGSVVWSVVYNLNPTSVGQVTLASADPLTPPLIDPNYYSTEVDRLIVRDVLRKNMRVLETEAGKSFILSEVPPPGFSALNSTSSDEELDRRVGALADSGSHPTGTCAMGKVLDSNLRVKGTKGLRVVDASIFPSHITAHNQAAVYAVAEKAADIIISDWQGRNGLAAGLDVA